MNFIKKIFCKKRDSEKVSLEWNEHLKKVHESIKNDELSYPIILFCHILWDFNVYNDPAEIIEESICGHWGLFTETFDPQEIVIDSKGKVFKLNKGHYDEITKTGFSYPSISFGKESLDGLKNRIINGCEVYITQFQEDVEIIKAKMKTVMEIDSHKELINFAGKELKF